MFQIPGNFRLHETTRKQLCAMLFLAFGVVPTAAVLAWGVARSLPGQVRAEAEELGRGLGLKASLARVRHPRPGQSAYLGIVLREPESGTEVLRCARADAAWSKPAESGSPCKRVLRLKLQEAEIDAARLPRLVEIVERALRLETAWSDTELRLAADALRIRVAGGSRDAADVEAFLKPVPGGCHGQLTFRLSGAASPEPIRLRVGRDRTASPPLSGFELDSGGAYLPCSALSSVLPGVEVLGPDARFRGRLWMNDEGQGPRFRVAGLLGDVDLAAAVSDRFGHTLTGTAQIELEIAHTLAGRLEEAAGSIELGPGSVSRSLLRAAVAELGMTPGVSPHSSSAVVPYERLALRFRIDRDGLVVRGACPGPGQGSVLVNSYSRLLGEPDPRIQPLPVAGLVRMLAPPGRIDVPATGEAAWLLRVLPVAGAEQVARLPPDEARR